MIAQIQDASVFHLFVLVSTTVYLLSHILAFLRIPLYSLTLSLSHLLLLSPSWFSLPNFSLLLFFSPILQPASSFALFLLDSNYTSTPLAPVFWFSNYTCAKFVIFLSPSIGSVFLPLWNYNSLHKYLSTKTLFAGHLTVQSPQRAN